MRIRKVVNRRLRGDSSRAHVVGDVNAVIAANVDEPGGDSHTQSRRRVRIVQRSTVQTPAPEGERRDPTEGERNG